MEFIWILGLAIALPLLWWAVKIILAYIIPAEKSGLAFLKQELKRIGVETNKIPDGVLVEIVTFQMDLAKFMAETNLANQQNWRANLVTQLEADAGIIRHLMEGAKPEDWNERVWLILRKYGVL